MARTMQTRKRSGGPLRRFVKKARTLRRSRFKRTSQFGTNSTRGGGIGFKSSRLSRRKWKTLLFNSSTAMTHYRANFAVTSTLSTPGVTSATMNTSLQTSRRFAGAAFFTTAGGAINPDGGAMPTFATNTDITVRGGMYGIRLTNTPDALDIDKDPINVFVYLIHTPKGFSLTNLPASVPVGWDPTLVQDFQTNIGRVIMKKSYQIRDGDVVTIERRMGVQKVDQTEYAATISEYVWLVLLGTTSSIVVRTIACTTYYNMSFSADVV